MTEYNEKNNSKGLRVLSLFDGISCGRVALDKANISVSEYNAFEIEENAIKISRYNYPDIKRYGDVFSTDFKCFNGVDLLMGGSPCQFWSKAKCSKTAKLKREIDTEGEGWKLFQKFVEAKNNTNPTYFLYENNYGMADEIQDAISEELGAQPIMIDSQLLSAQRRKRLYWTNIPIEEWEIQNVLLLDIAQNIEEKQEFLITKKVNKYLSEEYKGRKIQKTVLASIRQLSEKSRCLSTRSCDVGSNSGLCLLQNGAYYVATPIECERLNQFPDNWTDSGMPEKRRYFMMGNALVCGIIKTLGAEIEKIFDLEK